MCNRMPNLIFINEPIYDKNNKSEFPWRSYDKKKIQKSFYSLKKKINKDHIIFPMPYRRVGLVCTDVFFQKARLSTPSQSKPSCVDMWKKNKDKVLAYHNRRIKHRIKNDLFGTIVFMFNAPSHFSPYVSAMIYKYFNTTRVFDPYAGWGNRCLAAMACDIDYIGIDCNTDLKVPYKNLVKEYECKSNVVFISNYAENIDISKIRYDLVFTSPPFWNDKIMLERYKNCEINYNIFLKKSLFPVLQQCFKKSFPICLYINKKMYKDVSEKFGFSNFSIKFKSPTNNKKDSGRLNNIYCWNIN